VDLNWAARPAPQGALTIQTLDAHAAGEPLRIVTGGLPELQGSTMQERRRWLQDRFDDVRRMLMWEPRGHADMYGCVLTPPVTPESDLGVLFMHNEGYSTMCGHGVIALVTALLETGALPARGRQTPVSLDTPAGLVRATAHLDVDGRVDRVSFLNVPSFVYARDVMLDLGAEYLPGVEVDEPLVADVAFGGAFYAIVPSESVHLEVRPDRAGELVRAGEAIKAAVNDALPIQHPADPDLGFLYGAILTGPPEDAAHHSRNVCVFADGEVDRSPTGTGVSARLALLFARGEVREGEWITTESVLGAESAFSGRVAGTLRVGPYEAIVPEVSGRAFITGRHEFVLDRRDVLGRGFLVR
jgi:proline racemase